MGVWQEGEETDEREGWTAGRQDSKRVGDRMGKITERQKDGKAGL